MVVGPLTVSHGILTRKGYVRYEWQDLTRSGRGDSAANSPDRDGTHDK